MKIKPRDIARALIASIEAHPDETDQVCDASIALLRKHCPSVSLRSFLKIAEKELRRRGDVAGGMLVVPHEHSIAVDTVTKALQEKSGRSVSLDRKVDPDIIGGAVLLVDHRRIDGSVQGALQALLKQCLLPLD